MSNHCIPIFNIATPSNPASIQFSLRSSERKWSFISVKSFESYEKNYRRL